MAIAELIRAERLELASIGSKHGVLEAFNGLHNGSLVARLSRQLRAETQGSRAECARACQDQMLASESRIVLLCDLNTWWRGLKRRGHHVGPWLRCEQARGQLRAAYAGASVSVRCWHGRSACSRWRTRPRAKRARECRAPRKLRMSPPPEPFAPGRPSGRSPQPHTGPRHATAGTALLRDEMRSASCS
jgi:hypothetical protein